MWEASSESEEMSNVISPKHYVLWVKTVNGTFPVECLDVIEALGLDEDLYHGSAFQYVWRAGKKSPETKIEDLQKCMFYLQKVIDRERAKLKKRREDEEIPF